MERFYYVRIDPDPRGLSAPAEELGCRVLVSDEPWRGDLAVTGPDAVTPERITAAARRKLGLPLLIGETPRLLVRELTAEDFGLLPALGLSGDELRFLGEDAARLFRRDYFSAYVSEQYRLFEFGIWGMFEKMSGAPAGLIGFAPGDPPEFGLCTAKSFRRSGYGMEASRAVFSYAERELGFTEACSRVASENRGAAAFARELKTSLTEEGRLQFHIAIL